ncbi:hypothetical protein FACS1894211_10800 [Clostridia bacterium]|nr:hypothetical protein FACS1894211_10800 [Clostridia bacterium]
MSMGAKCKHCGSINTNKNGTSRGTYRYICKDCKRTFSRRDERFSNAAKQKVLQLYLNNVGIRKAALFMNVSRQTVLNWVRQAGNDLSGNAEILNGDASTENRT